MKFYVGLDVSVATTSICVIDEKGKVVREGQAESSPKAIAKFLSKEKRRCLKIGLEAGPLSLWLHRELSRLKFPVICIETRQASLVLKARANKTDRNDAMGIAQMMRFGLYSAVHNRPLESQYVQSILTTRRFFQEKLLSIENCIRGLLRNFGLKVGHVTRRNYAARIKELTAKHPNLRELVGPLIMARQVVEEQFAAIHQQVLNMAEQDEICRLLMTAPGVGPLVAITYRTAVDDPSRFRRSRTVGAYFGLTPRSHQSGSIDRRRTITKYGDAYFRRTLVAASLSILRSNTRPSPLKEWALRLAERRGTVKATIAVARRLTVILHRIWSDGVPYRWPT